MITLNLTANIENRLSVLAEELGKKQDELLLEAIINYLEDLEDIRDAQERLNDSFDSYLTIEEMEKKLGLED